MRRALMRGAGAGGPARREALVAGAPTGGCSAWAAANQDTRVLRLDSTRSTPPPPSHARAHPPRAPPDVHAVAALEARQRGDGRVAAPVDAAGVGPDHAARGVAPAGRGRGVAAVNLVANAAGLPTAGCASVRGCVLRWVFAGIKKGGGVKCRMPREPGRQHPPRRHQTKKPPPRCATPL